MWASGYHTGLWEEGNSGNYKGSWEGNYQSIMGGKGRPEAHGKEMELWVKQKTIGMMKS